MPTRNYGDSNMSRLDDHIFYGASFQFLPSLPAAADDAAAALLTPSVPVGGLYRTDSVIKIRVA